MSIEVNRLPLNLSSRKKPIYRSNQAKRRHPTLKNYHII